MSTVRTRSSLRETETSKLASCTPVKRRSQRLNPIQKIAPDRSVKKSVRKPKIHTPICHSSSDSSSGDDSDFEHNQIYQVEPMEDDDKENRRVLRSNKKLEKSSVVKNLKSMTLKTPEKKQSGPRKNLFKTPHVFQDSDEDYSDELGDPDMINICIERAQRQDLRIPLSPISTKLKNKKTVTPLRLAVSKTPGGTRNYVTRKRQNSDSDKEDNLSGLKLRIKLKLAEEEGGSVVETLKDLSCRLHLSEVPPNLPCRENEAAELRKFIEESIHPKYGESSAMYISGVPGTGKTATVRTVIESMKSSKKTNRFVYVEVNAMIFRKKVFVEIYNGIKEECAVGNSNRPNTKIAAATARQALNKMFRKADKNRPPIVILVDELDGLCNRKQDVLYDIFDWTSMPEARVTIVAIANTLDFPERMLCQRISSRLDKRRLIFQPYEHQQIEEIINARLNGTSAIEPNAVKLVAKKVSTISGDLRQALDMLRRSIRMAIERKATKLTMEHVTQAQKAVSEPFKYRLIKGLRPHKFILFRSVLTLNQEFKQEEVIFANVYKTYCVLCSTLSGISPVSDSDAYEMVLQLARCSILTLGNGQCGILRRRIKLGMPTHEAEKGVKEVEELMKSR